MLLVWYQVKNPNLGFLRIDQRQAWKDYHIVHQSVVEVDGCSQKIELVQPKPSRLLRSHQPVKEERELVEQAIE
jgi:hypothetical protein